jgi:PAS domain S-box-containing protein
MKHAAATDARSSPSDPEPVRVAPVVWTARADGHTEYLTNLRSEWVQLPVDRTHVWGLLRLAHPGEFARMRDVWEHAVRTEEPFELEARLGRIDSTYHAMEVHGAPRHGPDGTLLSWIGTCTDIDAQQQMLDRLREAETHAAESLIFLEALQSTAPVGFGFVSRDFRYLRVNETLAAINGVSVQRHIHRRVADVVPELWSQIEPLYRHVLETGEAIVNVEMVGEAAGASGQMRYWLISYYPVQVNGDMVGIGIVVVDISERREAEHLQSAVMANMAEGVYAVDGDGRLTFMNAAASRMLGWLGEELQGKPMHAAIHFQHADGSPIPAEESPLRRAQANDTVIRIKDDAYTHKDGSIVPVSYSVAPLANGTSDGGVVVVFRDTTADKAEQATAQRELETLTWVGRIRDALDDGRFVLHSQPILPLAGGEPAEELLVRMVGRDGELILPGSFLPAAERFALIGEIDEWVMREGIRVAAHGRRVQLNLSGSTIVTRDLLPAIERELRRARVDPSQVVFEITETSLMEDLDVGETFARGLADLGCGLALDDFGTGFGSFTYLKKLPIKYLKIDIEFVRELGSNLANQHVVRAVVNLARGFNAQTIAEGVEDAETMALLSDYGVDFAQGFHLGRPQPVTLD